MSKSQETFSKKEKEKKKIKKRQDKQLKKDARKESSAGGGLENMLTYVDEFGRFTDIPPEEREKIEIEAEDIEIGHPKKEKKKMCQRKERFPTSTMKKDMDLLRTKTQEKNISSIFQTVDLNQT